MKIFIYLLLLVPFSAFSQDDYYDPSKERFSEKSSENKAEEHTGFDCKNSYQKGVDQAKIERNWEWFAGGVCIGCSTGGCGGVSIPLAAAFQNNTPTFYPEHVDKNCYAKGYNKQMKTQKIVMSSLGAAIGLVSVVVFSLGFLLI